jgi:hypothetical protein
MRAAETDSIIFFCRLLWLPRAFKNIRKQIILWIANSFKKYFVMIDDQVRKSSRAFSVA